MTSLDKREYLTKSFLDENSDTKYPKEVKDRSKLEIPEIKDALNDKKNEQKEFTIEKLQRMDNREFLTIPLERRLQYITKNKINSEDISNGKINKLEFTFTFNGEYNEELYLKTTAGQVLPKEVNEVLVTKGKGKGIKFSRDELSGEFFNGTKRLIIEEGTELEVKGILSGEEVKNKEDVYSKKTNKYIEENANFSKYKNLIKESFRRGIEPELIILTYGQRFNKDNFASKTEIQKRISIEEMFTEFDRIKGKVGLSELKKSNGKYKDAIAVRMFKRFGGHNWKYYAGEYGIKESQIQKVEESIKKGFESLKLGELPKGVKGLLTFIGNTEAGKFNYNAIFNNANSKQPFDKPLSQLTVKEVIQRQNVYKFKHGKGISAAIGAYQFMDYTLQDMINRNIISGNEKFTPDFQDKIAIIKLKTRGLDSYMSGKISEIQFLHRLSCEWAPLPDPYNGGKSHYDKDGINHSLTSVGNSYSVLKKLKEEGYKKEENKENNIEKSNAIVVNINKNKKQEVSEIIKSKEKIVPSLYFTTGKIDLSIIDKNKEGISKTDGVFIFRELKNNLTYSEIKLITGYIKTKIGNNIKIYIDQEGGKINRYKENFNDLDKDYGELLKNNKAKDSIFDLLKEKKYFPSPKEIGIKYDNLKENKEEFLEGIALLRLESLKKVGINTYGMVCDIAGGNGVVDKLGRSFSNNLNKYKLWSDVMLKASEKTGVKLYLKHFPGHGNTGDEIKGNNSGKNDSHKGAYSLINQSNSLKQNIELFKYIVEKGKGNISIMTGHILLNNDILDNPDFQYVLNNSKNILTDATNMKGFISVTGYESDNSFFLTDYIAIKMKNKLKVVSPETGIR